MERVLEEISFEAPDMVKADAVPSDRVPVLVERATSKDSDRGTERVLVVDRAYVEKQVANIVKNQDLSRYIL
jgi:ATP-dependent HslUV protease ATP-binding subunit HslU